MHSVVRTYSGKGAPELLALLMRREADIQRIFLAIPGFVSYAAVGTPTGCFTVTTCETKEGADQSLAEARNWLARNAADLGLGAPAVMEGKVGIHMR